MNVQRTASVNLHQGVRGLTQTPLLSALVFLGLHIPLGLVMYQVNALSRLHAVITLLLGAVWAIQGKRPERVAYAGAYITGAEVLWRMTHAQVFWEFGKYATAAIFLLVLLRHFRLKGHLLPILYFILLLPSVLLTIRAFDPVIARKQISFNLSGPFALMISVLFFSSLKLKPGQLQQLFLSLMGPVVAITTITIFHSIGAEAVQFLDASNFATSGGYGPNQVSAVLGLGALLAFLLLLDEHTHARLKAVMLVALLVFAAQSAMTFSRGGLYSAVGGAVLAFGYLFRSTTKRLRLVIVGSLVLILGNFILLPKLQEITGGAIASRFQDTNLTGREQIAARDLEVWKANLLLGVGPGMSTFARESGLRAGVIAHTEFSRLPAEHGTFGVVALILLAAISLQTVRKARTPMAKAVAISLVGWSFLFMSANAMRLVAPSFLFGLASVSLSRKRKVLRLVLSAQPLEATHEPGPGAYDPVPADQRS